jgi:hypothetical protein
MINIGISEICPVRQVIAPATAPTARLVRRITVPGCV